MRNFGRLILGSVALPFIFSFYGCEKIGLPEKNRDERVLARINNYKMTEADFNEEKKPFVNYAQIQGDPSELKQRILDQLITRQLLLQEAQRLDLDKNKAFMKEIENYWKQALLTQLVMKKTDELKGNISVSEAEIEREYASMRTRLPDEADVPAIEPLEKMRPRIIEQIKKEKASKSLEDWVNKLKGQAQIKINPKVLEDIKLN